MQYLEMYHLSYFHNEIEALLRFTPKRDPEVNLIVDKSKRYDLLWVRHEEHRKWFKETQINDTFRWWELIDSNYNLIKKIFLHRHQ
jgi:hypothetical protein